MWVLVFILVHKTVQNDIVSEVLGQNEMVLVSDWIKSSLFKLFINQMITHVKRYEEVWLLIKLLQHVDLVHGSWSSLDNPTICLTIWHVESLSEQLHDNIIWYLVAIFDDLTEFFSGITLSSDAILDHLIDIDIDESVFLRDFCCMLPEFHARWPHHYDLWWLLGCTRVLEGKHTSHLLHDLPLALVAVDLDDITHKLLLDALDVHSVLSDGISGDLV